MESKLKGKYLENDHNDCEEYDEAEVLLLVGRVVAYGGRIPLLIGVHEQPNDVQYFT